VTLTERNARIVDLRAQGLSRMQVAEAMSVSLGTVDAAITRHNHAAQIAAPKPQLTTAERNRKIVELHKAGWTFSGIAREFGVTAKYARNIWTMLTVTKAAPASDKWTRRCLCCRKEYTDKRGLFLCRYCREKGE
jgi:DNA-binding NarL/FixJ family response regulator